jgi:hypothetical protein
MRRHYAFTLEPAQGGWRVSNVLEYMTRGQADKAMLTLVGRYGDADAVTLIDRPLIEGDILPPAMLKRPPPPRPAPKAQTPARSPTASRRSAHTAA